MGLMGGVGVLLWRDEGEGWVLASFFGREGRGQGVLVGYWGKERRMSHVREQ